MIGKRFYVEKRRSHQRLTLRPEVQELQASKTIEHYRLRSISLWDSTVAQRPIKRERCRKRDGQRRVVVFGLHAGRSAAISRLDQNDWSNKPARK